MSPAYNSCDCAIGSVRDGHAQAWCQAGCVGQSHGHTPGHIALFDRRDGTLIASDACQTKAGVAVSGTVQWLFPFPALATWHRPSALASARRLRSLAPTRLAVGHGDVLEEPLAAMDRAIAIAAYALGQVAYSGA